MKKILILLTISSQIQAQTKPVKVTASNNLEIPVVKIDVPRINPPRITKQKNKRGVTYYKLHPKEARQFKERLRRASEDIIRGTLVAEREVHRNTLRALDALIDNYSTINETGQALENQLAAEITLLKKHKNKLKSKFDKVDKDLENFEEFLLQD